MLILSRKETESIRIGESIVLTVVRVGRDRVQIGISAPPEVPIRRTELLPRGRAATNVSTSATGAADPLVAAP